MTPLPPQYDPAEFESKIYENWLRRKVFEIDPNSPKKKFSMVMPPPNVTGVLHMGHALTGTLEDIITRRKRMEGYETLWLPGTDHAGIATQMVVERNLMKEKKLSRHTLGREGFLKEVWAWKEKSQYTILSQMRTMGFGPDWTRLRFTLDEGVSRAVRTAFVRLFNEKLIYRGEAITQWCPRCLTALSDLEVKFLEKKGHLYFIRYVLASDKERSLTVATTRPETLLADVAVAVNPSDERFKGFHGKKVLVPLVNREVPVIADAYVDPQFGTGALKITPGHDPNDYEVGKRHGLPSLSLFDDTAKIVELGGVYKGLSRDEAREKIVQDLTALGLLKNTKDHVHSVGHCDRCQTMVEPRISTQWFVNAEVLAKPAISAVEKKEIRILPEEWEKTYFNWMHNIRPWCISRQLWWGHRIPVWYCDDCSAMQAAVDTPSLCEKCQSKRMRQDEDVLDTWFSSGLWPFSTLGWPEETLDLKKFYPTDVMETGFDILFFWVARMIMLGIKMTGQIPFRTVYLHPMVRDERGQKMSKTRGNVVDPLEIAKTVGADSLRFFLAMNAFQGRDLRISENQIEASRHFVNKVWNAARFVRMHFDEVKESKIDSSNSINQWILSAFNDLAKEVNEALEQYRFFDAANRLYHFLWDTYCFWFIEFIKEEKELCRRKEEKDSTAIEVLERILRLLHPFMPFVSEAIWQDLPIREKVDSLALASYPKFDSTQDFPQSKLKFDGICRVVNEIRKVRGVYNLQPAATLSHVVVTGSSGNLESETALMERLGRVERMDFNSKEPRSQDYVVRVLTDGKVFIPKNELGNLEEERARVEKQLDEKRKALQRAEEKLRNPSFVEKSPAHVRQGVEQNRESLKTEITGLEEYLKDVE